MSSPRGLYLPVYQSITTNPKVIEAAALLKMPRVKMIGHLVCLWTWALNNAPEAGGPLSDRSVAVAAAWPEGRRAVLISALLSCGLLEQLAADDTHRAGLYIHEWAEYGGKVASRAAADRARHPRKHTDFPRNSEEFRTVDETRRDETRRDQRSDHSAPLRSADSEASEPPDNESPTEPSEPRPMGAREVAHRLKGRPTP